MDKSKETFVRVCHFIKIFADIVAENATALAELVFSNPTQQSGSDKGDRRG